MSNWFWSFSTPIDKSVPPVYWLYSSEFQECSVIRQLHSQWLHQQQTLSFWPWLKKNYPDFYASEYSQSILKSKKTRSNYLRTIILKAAQFYRNKEKVGVFSAFWLEAMDPKHRNIFFLQNISRLWLEDAKSKLNFWQWLDSKKLDDIRTKYLTVQERQEYRLRYDTRNNLIYRGAEKQPFDTTDLVPNEDAAMFVMDTHHNMYVRECHSSRFHHSSFLSGKQVLAAGMIKIIKGKIYAIDDNSGHYRVNAMHLENALHNIPKSVFINGCIVRARTNQRREPSRIIVHVLGKTQVEIINELLSLLGDSLKEDCKTYPFLLFTKILAISSTQRHRTEEFFVTLKKKAHDYASNPNDTNYINFTKYANFLLMKIIWNYNQALRNLTLKAVILNKSVSGISYIARYIQYVFTAILLAPKSVTAEFNKTKNDLIDNLTIFHKYCNELLKASADKHKETLSTREIQNPPTITRNPTTTLFSLRSPTTKSCPYPKTSDTKHGDGPALTATIN